jgi:hypothetical protein
MELGRNSPDRNFSVSDFGYCNPPQRLEKLPADTAG